MDSGVMATVQKSIVDDLSRYCFYCRASRRAEEQYQ